MRCFIAGSEQWLLFLAQVPAAPSSARVTLWRRLRAAGAASVLNGAWVLPKTDEHAAFFAQLADTARENGGSATVFAVQDMTADDHAAVLDRFRKDRAREYDELAERCRSFLAEIERETRREKFTFAELEDVEGDFAKLASWLGKIRARDFFPDSRAEEAATTLAACERSLRAFAEEVYRRDGADVPADSGGS